MATCLHACIHDCILVPIPKGQKDASMSDNYHSIALAPSISIVLEWVILSQFSDSFMTSELQFGFVNILKLCTGFIKCVVSRYNRMNLLFVFLKNRTNTLSRKKKRVQMQCTPRCPHLIRVCTCRYVLLCVCVCVCVCAVMAMELTVSLVDLPLSVYTNPATQALPSSKH